MPVKMCADPCVLGYGDEVSPSPWCLVLDIISFPSSPLENEVFKPIFQQPAKSWEYFRDFVAVM